MKRELNSEEKVVKREIEIEKLVDLIGKDVIDLKVVEFKED